MILKDKRSFLIKTAATFIVVASLHSFSLASGVDNIYKFVPQDSVLAVHLKTSDKAWSMINAGGKFNLSDILNSQSGKRKGNPDLFADQEITSHIGSNAVFALTGFELKAGRESGAVFAFEMKDTSKHELIKKRIYDVSSMIPNSIVHESAFNGAKIYSILPKDNASAKTVKPSYYALYNKYLVHTNDVKNIQNSLKAFFNKAPGLASTANFSKSYTRLGSSYQAQLYLNPKKLGKALMMQIPQTKTNKTAQTNPWETSESVMMNMELKSNNITLKSFTVPDKNHALTKLSMQSKPSNFLKHINAVPKSSIVYMGFSDVKNAASFLNLSLSAAEAGEMKAGFKKSFGVNIDDVFSNIQGDLSVSFFNTEANPLIPGFALFVTPKDKTKMATAINSVSINPAAFEGSDRGKRSQREAKITRPISLRFNNTLTYKGIKIAVTNEIPELSDTGIKPAYTFIGSEMVVASHETVMKEIIDRVQTSTYDFSLAGNSDFLQVKKFLGENNNSLGYINLQPVLNTIDSFLPNDKEFTPILSNLKKFRSIGFNSINDKDGILSNLVIMVNLNEVNFKELFPPEKSVPSNIEQVKSEYY